jgi:hypothetical protein
MIDFPNSLPCALRDNYDIQHESPFVRSKLDSGRARQRRTFTSVPSSAQVSWIMTAGQCALFEVWFKSAIHDGADWFNVTLKTPIGLKLYKARFSEMYRGPTLIGVNHWSIRAQLELYERPIADYPPDWPSIAPDFIMYSNIFDIAMNQIWPS